MKTISVRRARSGARSQRVAPLDRLFAAYLAASGTALLFPARPTYWLWLALLHVGGVLLLLAVPPFDRMRAAAHDAAPRLTTAAHDWYALLVMPALYTELTVLNRAVWSGQYFDQAILRLEGLFFGGQPSQEMAAALPSLWVSEPLHLAYLSYYLIIFGPPLLLYLRRERDAFRTVVFTLMLTFFVHYLVFVYFPVQGPRYLFAAPGGALAGGSFYQLAHRILEAGSAQGSAFPSSHVAVSLAQTLCVARFAPRLTWPVATLTVGLAVGAIYGGFHYAIDVLVGAALGSLVVLCAPRIQRAMQRRVA